MTIRLLIFCFMAVLYGCESGWTPKRIDQTKSTCIRLNAAIHGDSAAHHLCNCYIQKLVERFPNNNQTPEEIQPIILECTGEIRTLESER